VFVVELWRKWTADCRWKSPHGKSTRHGWRQLPVSFDVIMSSCRKVGQLVVKVVRRLSATRSRSDSPRCYLVILWACSSFWCHLL